MIACHKRNVTAGVQTREVLDAMKDDYCKQEVTHLKVDGGASGNDLLMQIQADYLQVQW